jgi:hypothetical protein
MFVRPDGFRYRGSRPTVPLRRLCLFGMVKRERSLGQLSCQGLNQALAIPSVIAKSFGRLDAREVRQQKVVLRPRKVGTATFY